MVHSMSHPIIFYVRLLATHTVHRYWNYRIRNYFYFNTNKLKFLFCTPIIIFLATYTHHFTQDWNPTLGYPGEGHYQPTTIATFNAQGLASGGRLKSLLLAARRNNIHIILIQEHNLRGKHRLQVEKVAKKEHFAPFVGYVTTLHRSGGAAIFVDKLHDSIDSSRASFTPCMHGSAASVLVDLHGHRTRVTSVYVPVVAPVRKLFLDQLAKTGVITEDTIVGGDWNCVPNPTLDLQHQEGSNSSYPNSHANLVESLVAKKGLEDIHRLVNGTSRVYTRLGESIFTRLDRIYSPKFESMWRWHSVRVDATLFRNDWTSDHYPQVATLESSAPRRPTNLEAKIDLNLYSDPNIRKEVRRIWHSIYSSKSYEYHSEPFELAKHTCATYLLEQSRERKRKSEVISSNQHAKNLLKSLVKDAAKHGPSPEYNKLKKKLEDHITTPPPPKARTGYWAYVSAQSEELMSKRFLRKFKAKFKSSDISSLLITPDWFSPDTKTGTTQETTGILEQLSSYYRWTFRKRTTHNREKCLAGIRRRQLPDIVSKKMEGPISELEVRNEIRKLGLAKSPGPDLLTAEFYITFEDLVLQPLTEVLKESFDNHTLPSTTKQGVIKILYKKGDPRELRNYRPLTMLNTDYKILAKILNRRVASVIEHVVSSPQLGFVPGRIITEASHLAKLMQAYLDETDEEGLMIALDWEKAFDSISWDYLHDSLEAINVGPDMRRWYHILYNYDDPLMRCVQANGKRTTPFPINSGIPQGCPLSPITFIFVSEGLTRLIVDDPHYQGITIKGRKFCLSQFADDTLLYLKGYSGLRRAWKLIKVFEDASGMRLNIKKTEGLRCGALRRTPPPHSPELKTDLINWTDDSSWVRLLGIPFWETETLEKVNAFFTHLYNKAKARIASWNTEYHTNLARTRVATIMYLSIFRYWTQCMLPPKHLTEAIISDVQAFTWAKDPDLDPDEQGTEAKFRRWMKASAQYGNRVKKIGLGVFPWANHVRAIRARWITRYLDTTEGDYKYILDLWFARYYEGRGAVATTMPVKDLTKSLTYRPSSLPKFWVAALQDFRSLTIDKARIHECLSQEEAKAIPVWWSPLFKVKSRAYINTWRDYIRVVRLRDLIHPRQNRVYTHNEILEKFYDIFQGSGDNAFKVKGNKTVTVKTITNQWFAILSAIPYYILGTALGCTDHLYTRYSTGFKMLSSQGWRHGEGVGLNKGRPDPVELPPTNPGTTGLGHKSHHSFKHRINKWRSSFVASLIQGEVMYGKYEGSTRTFTRYLLTFNGRPYRTNHIYTVAPTNVTSALWWGKGIVGASTRYFPHPTGWTIRGPNCYLDATTVKLLTIAFTLPQQADPSCIKAWEERLGRINWDLIGIKYKELLLTPRDFMTHFKLILHRALFTRHINPTHKRANTTYCRLCEVETETIEHLATCPSLHYIWRNFARLANINTSSSQEEARLNLLGIHTPPLPQALSDLHLIIWKFILIYFTLVDLKHIPFDSKLVWRKAVRRYVSKANSLTYHVTQKQVNVEARKTNLNINRELALLKPLASIDSNGCICWSSCMRNHIHDAFDRPDNHPT